MLRAILMDFNGVILNDESFHLELYQKILADHQIQLSSEQYYQKYLVLDDENCFRQIFKDYGTSGKSVTEQELKQLVQRKGKLYQKEIGDRFVLFPGVVNFVQKTASRCGMVIVSGARRSEIKQALKYAHLLRYFAAIVSAEDVVRGKPDPEGLHLACVKLNEWLFKHTRGFTSIRPDECLVIEDSVEGIEMAHKAGMKCVAVTNTYPVEKLKKADLVIESFIHFSLPDAEKLFS
jgi:HAD superfamily hydrolase (TIGR01509 family)